MLEHTGSEMSSSVANPEMNTGPLPSDPGSASMPVGQGREDPVEHGRVKLNHVVKFSWVCCHGNSGYRRCT